MYYVYKITNKINGKWYIGKRKHNLPHEDKYMGSGKLIQEAISKHGKNNFTKEILKVFHTNDDAAKFEASLVTKEIISSSQCYNMHEGGYGGFAHLNDGSEKHLERSRLGGKLTTGRLHPNWGKRNFKHDTDLQKMAAAKGLRVLREKGFPEEGKRKISEFQKQSNSMKDRCWCVSVDAQNYEQRKVFHKDHIPDGWISVKEHRDLRKDKSNPAYGKFWIHNTVTRENKYCSGVIPEGWYRGRKNEYNQRNGG